LTTDGKLVPGWTRGSSEDHGPLHRKDAFTIQKILQSNLSQETEGR